MNTHLWISKNLWNEMLEYIKQFYQDFGKFPTKKCLRSFVKKQGLYSQVGQELVDRLIEAVWRKVKDKKNTGFPRFKSFNRMKSLVYPQKGFELNDKLKVSPFGRIMIKKHRETKGTIKTLALKREPSGKWFAVFCAEVEKQKPKINNGEKAGIDLGLKTLITISDGTTINNPRHFKKRQDKLAFEQRRVSRKKKFSNNWRRQQQKVSVVHEKIADSRTDFLHKLSLKLVNTYSLIAMEKLSSKEMAQQDYGKSINDAGWGTLANFMAYKAEGAGCEVVFVNPKNTTQECSKCGAIVPKTLFDRVHNCSSCGLSMDRDLNASINILNRATVGHTGSNACGNETKVSSMKQEAHTL